MPATLINNYTKNDRLHIFGFEKIAADPHVLAHINIDFPDDRYPKLNFTSQN